MRNAKKILILAMVALMMFGLCACGGEDAGGDALKGTWTRTSELSGEVVISFDGKGGCEASWMIDGNPLKDKGTYTIESDSTAKVTLEGWSEAQSFTYEVSDTALKITDNYSVFQGEYTKK